MPSTIDSCNPSSELLTEAAGVKIFMTPFPENEQQSIVAISTCSERKIHISLSNFNSASGSPCGFHLSKCKWDPYPWISNIESGSLAEAAGLRSGDCLINIDDVDLVGFRIKEIADLIRREDRQGDIKLSVWRLHNENDEENQTTPGLSGPLPKVARKLVDVTSGIMRALECPVCLESSMPPVSQCVNGHIICVGCRPRASRCPVCRVRLGQGRCLLADNLHKVFCDSFGMNEDECDKSELNNCNIFDRLFGRSKKKKESSSISTKTTRFLSKPRQLLLTRLLLGGLEKAVSADNLATASVTNGETSCNDSTVKYNQKLTLHDRTKSASTGELNKERNLHSLEDNSTRSVNSSSTSLASNALNTPRWGGSTDSVFAGHIVCPLLKQAECKESLTRNILLEHLSRIHKVPQVHFYTSSAPLPMPLPFGSDAVYILHTEADTFFLQCEGENYWISGTTRETNTWEWMLHGYGQNGTEIKLRRPVASLEDPFVLLPEHIALLPNVLSLNTLNITLMRNAANDELTI